MPSLGSPLPLLKNVGFWCINFLVKSNKYKIDMKEVFFLSCLQPLRLKTLSLGGMAFGFVLCFLALLGLGSHWPLFFLWAGLGSVVVSSLVYFWDQYKGEAGIRNHGVMFSSLKSRGVWGWMLGLIFTGFYVVLYWFPEYLKGFMVVLDPLSYGLRGVAADQWFVYGTFYTLAVLVMGFRMILRYRHNRYQVLRTLSVMAAQTLFAYLLPAFMKLMHEPEFYFHYFWPLKYDYLFPSTVAWLKNGSHLAVFALFWSVTMAFIATPILTYFFGKRWYCSWVCGCGGLAETLGDPFRHQSDKSLAAWQVERWMIHGVLVFVTLTTALLWANSYWQGAVLGTWSAGFAKAYGFWIGSVFSGVIGVGFYPLMGSRVWCRFGCPQAAVLGLLQKYVSRFRISTNGGQCISCGNCSTYCEMGIDVRWYAQRGENIVRASCVGCGICAAVCPRGVLRLENGDPKTRLGQVSFIPADQVGVLS